MSTVAVIYLGLVILWSLLSASTGDAIKIIRLINYTTPWIGVSLLPIGVLLIGWRGRVLGAGYLLVAVLVLAPYGGQMWRAATHGLKRLEPPPTAIHVMSYNTMGRNADVDAIASVIVTHQPDILFLQEVRHPGELSERLVGLYGEAPTYVIGDGAPGLMIVSRYPLRTEPPGIKVQRAFAYLPSGEVALRNLHFVRSIANDVDQLGLVDALVEDLVVSEGPIIVAGDFNLTQNSEGYRRITRILRNAHEETGRGFGFTFSTNQRRMGWLLPFVRIDHVFVSGHFEILDASRLSEHGNSDHFPINTQLILTQ